MCVFSHDWAFFCKVKFLHIHKVWEKLFSMCSFPFKSIPYMSLLWFFDCLSLLTLLPCSACLLPALWSLTMLVIYYPVSRVEMKSLYSLHCWIRGYTMLPKVLGHLPFASIWAFIPFLICSVRYWIGASFSANTDLAAGLQNSIFVVCH